MEPQEVHQRSAELQILDVRELEEWKVGHIDGALHIPMTKLPSRRAELDRDRPIAAVCRSGARSGRVTQWLAAQGYQAENMEGGMQAWARAGLPFAGDGGSPGRVA
jgi:rhodanese-related sulfurtransferase